MFDDKKFFNLLHIYEEEQLDFQDNITMVEGVPTISGVILCQYSSLVGIEYSSGIKQGPKRFTDRNYFDAFIGPKERPLVFDLAINLMHLLNTYLTVHR
ncbi:hypothetical protein STEG23_024109 [Scotinomys teguina]